VGLRRDSDCILTGKVSGLAITIIINGTIIMSATEQTPSASKASMQAILAKQKQAHISEGAWDVKKRIDMMDRAIDAVLSYQDEIPKVLAEDFGHRSQEASSFTDVMSCITTLKDAKKHVAKWMRPSKRKVMFPLGLLGAKGRVDFVPKGTVGVISPWNFPVNLTITPLAGIFAAGNRVMIKPSEFTPATSAMMAKMFAEYYDESELAVIIGGPEIGQEFSSLAFDHMLFTGATSIAKHVMRAAAENLVPLTLELGGKSPVVIGEDADIDVAAARIMTGKTLNAGQICLAPDYVMVPEGKMGDFVEKAKLSVETMFPTIMDNPDYTSVVNERHYDRLKSYIADAEEKGAEIVEINPANEDFSQQEHHKIPPTLVLNPTDDMKIMQEEIFGPLMPVKSYQAVDEAVDYINQNDRPLGLYYFGTDMSKANKVIDSTTSGGVTVNDVIMHIAQEDLPFGGVGPSGMGSYHGYDGFREFSHAKAVYTQSKSRMVEMTTPPYGDKLRKVLKMQIKK